MRMKRLLLLIFAVLLMNSLQAQTSKVNVTIDGPGVVDEYLTVDKDGKKQVKLKAVPSKFLGDVTFDGWSGDATGTSEELTVDADKAQNIHATFTYHRSVKKYPLLNLKQSWADMGKPMYVEAPGLFEREEAGQERGMAYLPVDYNRDGILDYIEFAKKGGMGIDNHRENVRFWLGQPDGSIDEDPKNDNRMLGTVYSIFLKYADFNDDGFPDFCSFSSGYDRDGSTGDYPVVLMSSPEGIYTDLRFTDFNHGYFHGGTTGDIDNDGDIDILFWDMWHGDGVNSLFLINDGKGNFTEVVATEILDLHSLTEKFGDSSLYMDMEVSDLNNDGYNDLFMLCNDHTSNTSGYVNPPIIFWGSESGKFSADNATRLPATNRLGYGICNNFVVYDLNGDGVKEVIVNRCGDGDYGGTSFYVGTYFQICEKEGDHYVDKTTDYIPVEHLAFYRNASEERFWIEEIDGIPYLCTGGAADYAYLSGVGVGPQKLYSINNGILEPVEGKTQTRYASYDEGIPLYVDGPAIIDQYYYDDGVNPIDTMAEHRWVGTTEGDEYWGDAFSGGGSGNMWRINLHHRKDTHFGRTCIRWNRDGLDPSKKYESQFISFGFISDIDIQELADEDYCLEFYIMNSDPDLTLNISFETYTEDGNGSIDGTSFKGLSATMSKRNVDGGTFTGDWQRVIIPLSAFGGDASFSKVKNFNIRIGDGDFNNEFYLDDIRIRKISSVSFDDYERAFEKGYLADKYKNMVRTEQVQSQEFKAMLKSLIGKFAPGSMDYFNEYITDYDVPLTRGMATIMAYYVARSIEAEYQNATNDFPDDMWDGNFAGYDELFPHWNDPGEEDYPEGMWWRSTDFGGYQTPWLWNLCHASNFSGKEVIALDKKAKTFHWDDPLTWEDAICAITRLCDSIDREPAVALGDANSDDTINAEDIKEIVNYLIGKPSDKFNIYAADANGDGEINAADIVTIVNKIYYK